MDRQLEPQLVEGEIGLVIGYQAGISRARDVLGAAMEMVNALDTLDHVLLSSIDTSLEPVSILNDIERSSLKLLLKRALIATPDGEIFRLEWKKWIGRVLVKAKYVLLQHIESDTPELEQAVRSLDGEYEQAPGDMAGFRPPAVHEVRRALDGVVKAHGLLPEQTIVVQTEWGDIELPSLPVPQVAQVGESTQTITNSGTELFKIRSPDMLGSAMWRIVRDGRNVQVRMLHRGWLERYQRRDISILPGDTLKCRFEETVSYDAGGNETERTIAIIEVLEVISPPRQDGLF